MSLIVDFNINKTSSTDGKYHLILIYIVYDDGSCEGAYYEPSSLLTGGVTGKSYDEIVNNAYESLEECMEDEDHIPFDIKNIKGSVMFDPVKCCNLDELDMALKLRKKGTSGEEMNKAILQMRKQYASDRSG